MSDEKIRNVMINGERFISEAEYLQFLEDYNQTIDTLKDLVKVISTLRSLAINLIRRRKVYVGDIETEEEIRKHEIPNIDFSSLKNDWQHVSNTDAFVYKTNKIRIKYSDIKRFYKDISEVFGYDDFTSRDIKDTLTEYSNTVPLIYLKFLRETTETINCSCYGQAYYYSLKKDKVLLPLNAFLQSSGIEELTDMTIPIISENQPQIESIEKNNIILNSEKWKQIGNTKDYKHIPSGFVARNDIVTELWCDIYNKHAYGEFTASNVYSGLSDKPYCSSQAVIRRLLEFMRDKKHVDFELTGAIYHYWLNKSNPPERQKMEEIKIENKSEPGSLRELAEGQ